MVRKTFQEPSEADVPAAMAPFKVFNLGKTIHVLTSTLPTSVAFDPYFCTIAMMWADGATFECCPFELLADETADEILSPVSGARKEVVRSQILGLWVAMTDALDAAVERGELDVVARDSAQDRSLVVRPASVWRLFEMLDWEKGIAGCPETGERIYDVHFRPRTLAKQASLKGGRPAASDWSVIKDLLREEVLKAGMFPEKSGPKGWSTQADAIRFVRGCLRDRKEKAQLTALKTNTRRLLDELKAENLPL